jgi:Domain of unknown function (DUF4145)
MSAYHSKRAEVLRKVLDYINHDDWVEFEGFMIFGKEPFDISSGVLEASPGYDSAPFRNAESKSKVSRGKRAIAKRVKLGTPPEDETLPEKLRMLKLIAPRIDITGLNKVLALHGDRTIPSSPVAQIDEIDAALATEFVGLLEGSMAKISDYDDMPVRYPNAKVQQYFDQAHRCYLYGLAAACAVLCRAILEAALIEKVDPRYTLLPVKGTKGSHISGMIERATDKKFFDQERAQCARQVIDAGNNAIHNLPQFQRKYEPRMGEIVDNTRKIVIDLYILRGKSAHSQ